VAYVLASLLPLDVTVSLGLLARKYRRGGILLVPFQAEGAAEGRVLQAFASNAILWAPVGVFVAMICLRQRGSRSVARAIAVGGAVVMAVELAQILVLSRVADVTDVLSGTVGVFLGVAPASGLFRHARTSAASSQRLGRIGFLVASGCCVAYHWSPFDFTLDSSLIQQQLVSMWRIPFWSYYETPEGVALESFVVKFLFGASLGLGAAVRSQATVPSNRAHQLAAAAGVVAFFMTVELGQAFLPGRWADVTDVLVAVGGAACGAVLGHRQGGFRDVFLLPQLENEQ
jgi:glycopeptide antibiotics resistance protein